MQEREAELKETPLRAKLLITNATVSRELLEIPRSWEGGGPIRSWSESHNEEGHWEEGTEGGKGLVRSHG